MIMPQKQKIATIFTAKLTGKDEGKNGDFVQRMGEPTSFKSEYEAEGPDDSAGLALESAASSIIAALEKKDAKALKMALKDFIYCCEESPEHEMGEMD